MENQTSNKYSLGEFQYRDFSVSSEEIHASVSVPTDHPHMDGHFDSFKILPGVTQVAMVLDLLRMALQREVKLKGTLKGKFGAMIRPEQDLQMKIQIDKNNAMWTLSRGKKICSRGKLIYE